MTAKTANGSTSGADDGALDAMREDIAERMLGAYRLSPPTPPTPSATPTSDDSGSTTGKSESASESPTSQTSDVPSRRSKRRFRQPKNVREFASQANTVASLILNGEIDLDTARAYSAVARTVAQAVTAQTVHARFLKATPDLDFADMEEPSES